MPPRKPKKKTGKDIFKELDISLDSSIDDVISNLSGVEDSNPWITDHILTYEEFFYSPEHMNFPKLSKKQKDFCDYLLGSDPKKIFENNRKLAVCVFGKGSGKDTISALIQLYIVYVLLNLKNPQKFLNGAPPTSTIDLLNVASSKDLAEMVYFNIVKNMVKEWKWARNKWKMVVNGRFYGAVSEDLLDKEEKITITNDSIIFPKNIRMISGSSEAESSEGKNILFYVLDEADAFKDGQRSADKLFRVCRTSSSSRFGDKAKGIIISYPRSEDGFIMKLYKSVKDDLSSWCDIGATWEVKPREMFSKEEFEFEGELIPMDFYNDFKLDPIGSKAAYMCKPPKSENSFIEDQGAVERATMRHPGDIVIYSDKIDMYHNMVKKEILQVRGNAKNKDYVLCFDLGQVNDATALCIAHRESDTVVIDSITDWRPVKSRSIKVDLVNVYEIINELNKFFKFKVISCDHWNSAIMLQTFESNGYNVANTRLNMDDYSAFKRYLYSGHIILPPHERLINEIKQLQLVSGNKVDHPDGKHNDLTVTVVMAMKILMLGIKKNFKDSMLNTGTFVEENNCFTNSDFDGFKINNSKGYNDGFVVNGINIYNGNIEKIKPNF